jgi:hypothetical protein
MGADQPRACLHEHAITIVSRGSTEEEAGRERERFVADFAGFWVSEPFEVAEGRAWRVCPDCREGP